MTGRNRRFIALGLIAGLSGMGPAFADEAKPVTPGKPADKSVNTLAPSAGGQAPAGCMVAFEAKGGAKIFSRLGDGQKTSDGFICRDGTLQKIEK